MGLNPSQPRKVSEREHWINAQVDADYQAQFGKPIPFACESPHSQARDPSTGELLLVYQMTGEPCYGESTYPFVVWTYSLKSGTRTSSYCLEKPVVPGALHPYLCALEDRNSDGVLDYFIGMSHRDARFTAYSSYETCFWVDGATRSVEVQDPLTRPDGARWLITGSHQSGQYLDALYIRSESQGERKLHSIRARATSTGKIIWEYLPPERLLQQQCRSIRAQPLRDFNGDGVPEIGISLCVVGSAPAIWLVALNAKTGQPLPRPSTD